MTLFQLFNAPRPKGPPAFAAPGPRGGGPKATSSGTERQGAFVTPQSLTTFAGASTVVALLWKTSNVIVTGWGQSILVAFVCSVVVGALLFLISETDPARAKLSAHDYLVDGFVAVVNMLVLFSAAVGATQVAGAGSAAGGSSPTSVHRPL